MLGACTTSRRCQFFLPDVTCSMEGWYTEDKGRRKQEQVAGFLLERQLFFHVTYVKNSQQK